MFIAMNRFKVRKGEEPAVETRWRERDTHLHIVPGLSSSTCSKAPSATIMYSTRRIRSGGRTPISKRGPVRKPSARHTATLAKAGQ